MRVFSAQLQALLAAGQIRVQLFARLALATGYYGASDAAETFSWDNGTGIGPVTFGGFGKAFSATVPPSTAVVDAASTTGSLSLSGTDPDVLATFLGDGYRAQTCDVGLLFFDTTANAPVQEIVAFRGLMDTAGVTDGAADPQDPSKPIVSTLTVLLQPRTLDLSRKGARTRSDTDQRLHRDDNDAFFQDVGLVAQTQINWDRSGPASPRAILGTGASTSAGSAAAAAAGSAAAAGLQRIASL